MKLIILAGNHKSNKKWLDESAEVFTNDFDSVYAQEYSHWEDSDFGIDFDKELEKLVANLKNEKEYVISAKSAGAILAIYGIYKGDLKPKKCFFAGIPLKWSSEKNIPLETWLDEFNVPTTVIQNSDDPMASFNKLKNLLEQLKKANIKITEISGNTHSYSPELIKNMSLKFLKDEQFTDANQNLKYDTVDKKIR